MRKFEITVAGCKSCYKNRLVADLKKIEPRTEVLFTNIPAEMPYISVKRNLHMKGLESFMSKTIYQTVFISRIPRVWRRKFLLLHANISYSEEVSVELTRT